jgi:hypothetical protein
MMTKQQDAISAWLDELPFHFCTAFYPELGEEGIVTKIMPKKGYQILEDINFDDQTKQPDWQLTKHGKLLLVRKIEREE